jgi:hypothetical protein
MAALPIFLPNGTIAVYGTGSTTSPSGISNTTADGEMRWGSVYQIWNGGATYVYGGDNVMFKETDVVCRLAYNNIPYTIVPARLVTKQEPLL